MACDTYSNCRLDIEMVVRDSKDTGTFTKREIDRAIRTVERTGTGDYSV